MLGNKLNNDKKKRLLGESISEIDLMIEISEKFEDKESIKKLKEDKRKLEKELKRLISR